MIIATDQKTFSGMRCLECNQHIYLYVDAVVYVQSPEHTLAMSAVPVHSTCFSAYKNRINNKSYKCPKCYGTGSVLETATMTYAFYPEQYPDESYVSMKCVFDSSKNKPNGPSQQTNLSSWTVCKLCSGEGCLEKEPIPVIVDWKLAP